MVTIQQILQKNIKKSDRLNRILLRMYKTEIENKVDTTKGESFDNLKKKINPRLYSELSNAMIESYKEGGQNVTDRIGHNAVPYFKTGSEGEQLIDNQVRLIIDAFWKKIQEVETRNQAVELSKNLSLSDVGMNINESITIDKEGNFKQKNELEYLVYLGGTSRAAVFMAYNMGSINAPPQVIKALQENGIDAYVDDIDYIKYTFAFKWKRRNPPSVDPFICEPLRDKLFPIDATYIPIPILSTHKHCRCLLILVRVTKKQMEELRKKGVR